MHPLRIFTVYFKKQAVYFKGLSTPWKIKFWDYSLFLFGMTFVPWHNLKLNTTLQRNKKEHTKLQIASEQNEQWFMFHFTQFFDDGGVNPLPPFTNCFLQSTQILLIAIIVSHLNHSNERYHGPVSNGVVEERQQKCKRTMMSLFINHCPWFCGKW